MVNPLKSLSIRGKLLLAFSIISLISTVAFSSYTYFLQRATILDGIDEKLKVAARSVQPLLPDGFHDRITDKTRSPPRSTWPTCTC